MKFRIVLVMSGVLLMTGALLMLGQQPTGVDIPGVIKEGEKPVIAVPDFRGAGDAQKAMDQFNKTLWSELEGSGALKMAPKTLYPLAIPQQPSDFRPPTVTTPVTRGAQPQVIKNGPWLTDWSGPPVNANDLAIGYTVAQDGRLVLYGYLYNLSQSTVASAQLINKTYFGSLDNAGATLVARQFAADILQQFGAKSLLGSKIFFVSDRSGVKTLPNGSKFPMKEIWSMDYDGSNQKQLTFYKTTTTEPAVSPDGKLLAFVTYPQSTRNGVEVDGQPQIMMHSVETGRRLTFSNFVSSVVETPEFTPDGKRLLFSTTVDKDPQVCISDINGGNFQRISRIRAIEVSPKVNPRTGSEVLFISGRSGHQQLWRMNIDGSDPEMLTTGEGDVANPSWRPDGQFVAFAWTRGYEPGNFNIFIMDMGKRVPIQLTHGMGRNENPSWAPDGIHLVFSSKQGRSTQLFTMLADGTHVQQLTNAGNNLEPVWAKGN
ncbi:MAG: PD40 domain-containing protein [Bryobacterales bacterium]|nr:PD40 domain-containing protein [Bryobacterales bacterium]MBV9401345.1 PD40 domain-containing protein [Bryobacterales bacterium]